MSIDIGKVLSQIGNWIAKGFHNVAAEFDALFDSIYKNGGAVLMAAAAAAVQAAETEGGTSDEKKAAAVAAIIKVLKEQGIPVVMNAINGAIEAEVAKLTQAAAVAPAVTPSTVPAVTANTLFDQIGTGEGSPDAAAEEASLA